MADASDSEAGASGRFNNRIAITIAVLASFVALSTIKSSNVAQAMEQAQAERNNGWAWYQAVRVREDMATYELAHLQRLARAQAAVLTPANTPSEEAQLIAAEIAAQEAEIVRVRARKDEVEQRARAAEAQLASLSVFDDQYDFSEALVAIAVTLLAVCALARARWLYWFSLIPALAGVFWGVAAILRAPIHSQILFAWLA